MRSPSPGGGAAAAGGGKPTRTIPGRLPPHHPTANAHRRQSSSSASRHPEARAKSYPAASSVRRFASRPYTERCRCPGREPPRALAFRLSESCQSGAGPGRTCASGRGRLSNSPEGFFARPLPDGASAARRMCAPKSRTECSPEGTPSGASSLPLLLILMSRRIPKAEPGLLSVMEWRPPVKIMGSGSHQNLQFLQEMGRVASRLQAAHAPPQQRRAQAAPGTPAQEGVAVPAPRTPVLSAAEQAVDAVDQALEMVRKMREERNQVLREATATWQESWLPRVTEANGRRYVHELD